MALNIIPKGALLTATSGEFSDYQIRGVFRAEKDIPIEALLAQYLADNPSEKGDYHFREAVFLGCLNRSGYLAAEPCYELFLGSYSRAAEVEVSILGEDDCETGSLA